MRLAAENISVRLGAREVVGDASLVIEPGEIVAVIGPNGAGKSTLLKALAGLLAPFAGRVLLNGEDVSGLDRRRLARAIAYLPQERAVGWPVSVERIVALGRMPHAGPLAQVTPADRAAIDAALSAMDLLGLAMRRADRLSGGELARALLARALAQEASILIADEPTAGLDMAHVLQLFTHLERLAAAGHGIVVAVHDLSLALRHCRRSVLLHDGRILAAGPSADVVTSENLARAFGISARIGKLDDVSIVLAERSLT
ncbi:MAG: ABC transporter ATP-binding protein [Hyphomicrobiaceae bacterium]|nr:ABC transporter ATP-binding protein [Hyphomicrobiaceae bacterium]